MVDKNYRRQKLEFSAIVHAEQEDASEESETIFGSTLQADITTLRHTSINRQLGQIPGDPLADESCDESSESELDSPLDSGSDVSASVYSISDEENFLCDSFSSSDEDDGITKDQVEELSHLTETVNGDVVTDLSSAMTDLDLTRKYFIEHEQHEISMELENTTLDEHAGEIYAPSEANAKEIKSKIYKEMEELYHVNVEDTDYKLANQDRFLVSLKKLRELKGSVCMEKLQNSVPCNEILKFESDTKGCTVKLRWSCKNNHYGMWVSSEVVAKSHHADIYLNDLLVTACILLSGNNYSKFALFCKFLGLAIPDHSVFCRNQRMFFTPVILQMWETMKSRIIALLQAYRDHILGGDGRNDSPGFCARFCVYVAMELISNVVLHIEVLDKRETGGISTNMEREGLTRTLMHLMKCLDISEITTDASTSIMKRIQELKGKDTVFYFSTETFKQKHKKHI